MKLLTGTYRTFDGYQFRPFSNGGKKFGAVVARKRNDGNGMNCLLIYEELNKRVSCCARKLKDDKRRIFLPPQEWKGKAYAITQFDQLSMIMEYEEIATDNEGL